MPNSGKPGQTFRSVLSCKWTLKSPEGEITIRDMFNLYKYENGLYLMKFTGQKSTVT